MSKLSRHLRMQTRGRQKVMRLLTPKFSLKCAGTRMSTHNYCKSWKTKNSRTLITGRRRTAKAHYKSSSATQLKLICQNIWLSSLERRSIQRTKITWQSSCVAVKKATKPRLTFYLSSILNSITRTEMEWAQSSLLCAIVWSMPSWRWSNEAVI